MRRTASSASSASGGTAGVASTLTGTPTASTTANLSVAVDAVNTAYAFQLYEMLRQKGLNKSDYEVKSVGGTGFRLEAMTKDKTMVAAMLNPLIVAYSVQWFGNWNVPLYVMGVLFLVGAACWLVVDPRRPVFAEPGRAA